MSDEQTQDIAAPKVTIEDIGPARKKLTIEVSQEAIQAKIDDNFVRLQDDAVIPGFRKGRAPQRLIQKRFGESIRTDVKGQLIGEAYSSAIEEHKLDVIGEPDADEVENLELPESGPMTFSVEVEITPEVELPDFATLKIEKEKAEVTPERIDEQIERYCEQMGRTQAVTDTEVAASDFVSADVQVYAGKKVADDAEPISEHPGTYIVARDTDGDARGHVVGIVVEDLGTQLIGKKPGDTVDITTTGPERHENEAIQGQEIVIRVKINQIERLEPATLEQVIEQAGAENEEKLREQIGQMMEQQVQQEQATKMRDQALEQLLEKVDLELPEGLTGRQIDRQIQRQKMEAMYRGASEQEVEQQAAEMRTESEEAAIKQLKEFFIVDRAAKDMEIEVSQNELNGRIAMMAMQRGRRPEKVRQEMQRSGQLENLYLSIREQKTLDAIVEKAEVVDVDAPAADSADKPAKKSTKKKSTKKKDD